MAINHDLADAFQLREQPGWKTLKAILVSTGERNPKRPRGVDESGGGGLGNGNSGPSSASHQSRSANTPSSSSSSSSDERLAKRIAGVRLSDDKRLHEYDGRL